MPVVASLGIDGDRVDGQVLNINADVMACRLAAALGGAELVIAGGTPGVLDGTRRTIPALDIAGIDALIASGTATAGMVAKLASCRDGARGRRAVDSPDRRPALDDTHGVDAAPGTTLGPGARRPA